VMVNAERPLLVGEPPEVLLDREGLTVAEAHAVLEEVRQPVTEVD